tara:strand:- start:5733 stop:5966 length:234 start_codon:yes stop_codon:yes gene_type:complete
MKTFVENGITHLDLHGVRHHEVNELVLDFILRHQDKIPLVIICGNSVKMISLTKSCMDSNDIKYQDIRFGLIRVEKI